MYEGGIVTVSDKGAAGEREDKSGPMIESLLDGQLYHIASYTIVPDEPEMLKAELLRLCDDIKCDLVLTTGGTGFSPRDNTPEVTMEVGDRNVPGIAEGLRAYSMTITKRAMLSRAASVIRRRTLIVNLPGSPKAVKESLEYLLDTFPHGLDILTGRDGECAR